ncbi:MAG TPA: ABC transporter ATP-binding protein [bacterium]|nr:ABC transporter ATP-binding protein [bacterium]
MPAALEIKGLRKRFRRDSEWLDVLAGVSLDVGPREFVTLVGPSGCGKSTICNIVAGLVRPDAGIVTIAGPVAYMQQKDLLLPWRTVLDNAILGLEIQGTPRAAAREEARAMLRRFGLEGFERAYPATLSGGMRQRVALVRTLLCRRELLALDEPFGALDAMTRGAMQGYLLRLREEFGRTVLFITHDVEEAVLLSDRIYVMAARPGRIRAERRVDLPHPRRATDPGVVAEKAAILNLLHAEMTEAFA